MLSTGIRFLSSGLIDIPAINAVEVFYGMPAFKKYTLYA
jgi:hypothetical protein